MFFVEGDCFGVCVSARGPWGFVGYPLPPEGQAHGRGSVGHSFRGVDSRGVGICAALRFCSWVIRSPLRDKPLRDMLTVAACFWGRGLLGWVLAWRRGLTCGETAG